MLFLSCSEAFYSDMMDDAFGIDDISMSNPISLANQDIPEVNATHNAKKKWARSANYSVQEDEALVLAWESVSLDPVIGKDQSMKTYWKRIADHFHRNVKTPSNRSVSSLSHRWSSIQEIECCNRWAGCVVNIDCAQPSGATLQDRVSTYNQILHCYLLIRCSDLICIVIFFYLTACPYSKSIQAEGAKE